MNTKMALALTIIAIIVAVVILIIMAYKSTEKEEEEMKETKETKECGKTFYPELPLLPKQDTYITNKELARKMKEMGINHFIATIILAIRMIEQPEKDPAPNYNFWGIHTDVGRWSIPPDYRVCAREAGTRKMREYAGFYSLENALRWMNYVITRKYNEYMKRFGRVDFADFYARMWKGGEKQTWYNQMFAKAGQIMEGIA